MTKVCRFCATDNEDDAEECKDCKNPFDMTIKKLLEEIATKKLNMTTEMIRECVMRLKDKYHFVATNDNEMLHVYNNGIYRLEAESLISKEVQDYLGEHTRTSIIKEVIAHITHSFYIKREIMNADLNLINVKNGIYNIKTKEFMPHSSDIVMTIQLPVIYNKDADCPKIKKFLSEVLYPADMPFVQEFFGFCLYRNYFLRKAMIMFGHGANGKTTLAEIFQKFIGEEENTSGVSLNRLANERFSAADLYGKSANIYDELERGEIENASLFKQATGGSRIRAEFKGKNAFYFYNFAKFIYSCNETPDPKDTTDAFFDRIELITFPNRFVADPDPESENEKKARNRDELVAELTTEEELSGLFNWALEGLERILKNNCFTGTKTTVETRRFYTISSSPITAFIEICTTYDTESNVSKRGAFTGFLRFCQERRLPPLSYQVFCQKFFEKTSGLLTDTKITVEGKRIHGWMGIKLKTKEEMEASLL